MILYLRFWIKELLGYLPCLMTYHRRSELLNIEGTWKGLAKYYGYDREIPTGVFCMQFKRLPFKFWKLGSELRKADEEVT